jgi:hypothetical protein
MKVPELTTATAVCPHPAAQDRHVPIRPVAPPLCRLVPRRPASTGHDHPTMPAASSDT